MVPILIIAVVWLAVMGLVAALCAMAARGDEQIGAKPRVRPLRTGRFDRTPARPRAVARWH